MLDEMAFQKALAHYSKEFDDAEPFNDWYPPDNDYTCMVSKIRRGVKEKEGSPFMWWDIVATIYAPDHEEVDGRDFSLAFLCNRSFGKMKTICNQISQNTAKRSIEEYNQEIDGYVGTVLTVRVERGISNKGKPFVNCSVQDVLPGTEESPPQSPESEG